MAKKQSTKGTALVTGGAKRIGQAICLNLAKRGYKIALHCHTSTNDALETAQHIKKSGGACEIFPCDLSNAHQASLLINKVHQKYPDFNLLVNNASIFEKSTLKAATIESFDQNINLHLRAPFILSRDFANICQKGQIIHILDTNIAKNKTQHFTYLLSKKALLELTKLSAVELAPDIRVNAIAPGLILPPKNEENSYLDRLAKNVPLKITGNIKEIIQTIEFLLDNPYLTGQIIFNDGGEHLI